MLEFPVEAVEDVTTVELAADGARDVEAVTLPPVDGVIDEEVVPDRESEEDTGETEFPTDEVPVTVLEAEIEAVDEARDPAEENSAADEKVDDVEDETDTESDDTETDGT